MPLRFPITTFGGLNQNDQEETLIGRAYQVANDGASQRAPLEATEMINIDFETGGIRKRKGSSQYKNFTASGSSPLSILVGSDVLIEGVEWVDPATGAGIEVVVSKKTIYTNESGTFAQIDNAGGTAYLHQADVSKVSFAEVDGHLFIGLNGSGNYIQVYRSGDALDNPLKNEAKYTDVDQDSAAAAAHVYVTDQSQFAAGDRIVIGEGTANQEYNYVASVAAGDLTVVNNLAFTHLAQTVTRVVVAKTFSLRGVAYGEGLYVAVGYQDGTDAYIVTSPDAATWTERTNPNNSALNDVIYANGQFVAVGSTYIITSPDGITWTSRTVPITVSLDSVTYNTVTGEYIAVGDYYVLSSADSITWTVTTTYTALTTLSCVYYNDGEYYIVGRRGSPWYPLILKSTDGLTWSEKASTITTSNRSLSSIIYAQDMYVAGGSNGIILTSVDGDTWVQQSNPNSDSVLDLAYGSGMFIGVGSTSDTITSTDGVVWNEISNPTANNVASVVYGANLFVATGGSTSTASLVQTITTAVFVSTANEYIEAFDTSTAHSITGVWDDAAYIVAAFQSRLIFSTGNTVVNYTPEAYTTGSGIWDLVGAQAGFVQAAGNIKSMNAFAPKLADQINEAFYIGTERGFDVLTGFTANDRLVRIEGAKSPINHRSVAESNNWLVYLTDDKNIMAINGVSVINLGRRFKTPGGGGVLDNLVVADSKLEAYGFYNPDKAQCIFGFTTNASYVNRQMAVLDFALGEPTQGESLDSIEQRVRCLFWDYSASSDMFSSMYQSANGSIGILGSGILYKTEDTNLDLGAENIDTTWVMPVFNGGSQEARKQWYRLTARVQRQVSNSPVIRIDVYLDRSTSSYKNTSWTVTGASPAKQISEFLRVDTRSEAIQIKLTSTDAETWTLFNLTLGYDIGAEILL